MDLSKHIADHVKLGLDFRIPADGNTYIEFSTTSVKIYVNGTLKAEWTS